jgi:hypothetical protein
MTYINLKWTPTGWLASFEGGNMPQNTLLPLPWTAEAGFTMVKRDLESRFPGCRVSASARSYGSVVCR